MSIKIERACRAARLLPKAEAEILSSIPDALVASLTSRQLTLVMLALDSHWEKARRFERNEALTEGYVWDAATNRLREIA